MSKTATTTGRLVSNTTASKRMGKLTPGTRVDAGHYGFGTVEGIAYSKPMMVYSVRLDVPYKDARSPAEWAACPVVEVTGRTLTVIG